MKKCTACRNDYELDGFFRDPSTGQAMSRCKSCVINGSASRPSYISSKSTKPEHIQALAAYNAGKKYREIAADMGRPINTIKVWISRAREVKQDYRQDV